VICTFDRDFVGQAHRIHEALAAAEAIVGKLVRVNRVNPPTSGE
jgi:hypothetical protein